LSSSSLLALFTLACAPAIEGDPPDDEGVTFADLRAEALTATSAWVRFTTSEPTTCEVEYGTRDDALDDVAVDPTMEEGEMDDDHEVLVEGLSPQTTYYWRGRVVDADGEVSRSDVLSFTTLAGEDSGEENVALLSAGARVTGVSSNFGGAANDETWGANNAFDGLLSSEWATAGDGDDAWVEVTLAAERELTSLGFQSRKMSDGSSIITELQLSDGAGTVLAGPFTAADPDQLYRFELDPKVTARVIRVEALTTTGGNTGVKEVQLFSATE
jgi:hypothetical protein